MAIHLNIRKQLPIFGVTVGELIPIGIVALLVLTGIHNDTGSDPRASLLVSESILTHGTIRLDHYGKTLLDSYGYVIHNKGGHYYYYFPLGTPLFSVPFVAALKLTGASIASIEPTAQVLIAALAACVSVLLLIKIGKLFLGYNASIVVGLLFWLGSSLSSTNGTALWSHNAAVVFGLSAIYLSLKASLIKDYKSWPLVSFFLFAGYLSRPTMALLTPFLLLFTLTYSKKAAAKMATGLTILVISFILFSLAEFHQPLPDYYLPSRINSTSFYTALAGNLISPSRGILIFMPIVTFAIIFIMRPRHNINLKGSWLLMGIAWPIFHLLAISRFPHWWGGYSYGPRLMTDCLPGLYLLLIDGLPFPVRNKADKIALIAIGFAASFSIWINTCQGLFNPYTGLWNAEPSVDMHPQLLFDWSYPQFAASKHGHLQRLKRFASSPNQ